MKKLFAAGVTFALIACLQTTSASGPLGIYGIVDKVVFEPNEQSPERIQVWGAFSFADTKDGSAYGPAQRGYLYYTCPAGQESICRKEWSDLKSVAGKGTGVGFGFRYADKGRVRKADEKASSPDPYPIERGLVKVENASDRGSETMQVIDSLRAAMKQR